MPLDQFLNLHGRLHSRLLLPYGEGEDSHEERRTELGCDDPYRPERASALPAPHDEIPSEHAPYACRRGKCPWNVMRLDLTICI